MIKRYKGFSLIEILVVVSLFAVLAVVTTQAIATTLKNSAKNESLNLVKTNLDNALNVIQRQVYNAKKTVNCGVSDGTAFEFTDQNGTANKFLCKLDTVNNVTRIASGSAETYITSEAINISNCSFTCTLGSSGVPDSLNISLSASSSQFSGYSGAYVTKNVQILLRNY